MNRSTGIVAAALMAAAASWLVAPAAAGPMPSSLGLHNAAPSSIEAVQYRRGWRGGYRGGGFVGAGVGLGLGIAAGVVGGAIAATQPYGYYGYDPGYAYGPGDDQGYTGGDAVGYCMQRFRSYDPSSGTYLGFDGFRHPCP
jgi:BA14K-like protein